MTVPFVLHFDKKNIVDVKLPNDLTKIIADIKPPPMPEFYLCNICGQLKEKGMVKPCAGA